MITIIVLYILLGLIALIVILLHFSVRVYVSAQSGEKPEILVKWLFITLYPRKEKEKEKEKKESKRDKKDKPSAKTEYSEADIEELIRQADELEMAENDAYVSSTEPESIEQPEDVPQSEMVQTEDKPERKEKKKKEKKHKAEKDGEEKSEGGIAGLRRKYEMAKPYIPMTWKAFRKLLKAIRITKLDVRLVSGKEDAYEAAMMYGKLNAAAFNAVSLVGGIFTVQAKNVQVDCRFNEKIFEYDASTVVLLRLSTVIAIVFCLAVKFLSVWLPKKMKEWRERRRIKRMNKKSNKKLNETELLTNE